MTGAVRVVVTRAVEGAAPLLERLHAHGLEVAFCPLVRIEPIDGPPLRLDRYDWLVLTSARAVELLVRRLEGDPPAVAAIGPGTAASLRAHGIEPALVPVHATQEGLLDELRAAVETGGSRRGETRVVFAGAEGARDLLARELEADVIHLYRTLELSPQDFPDGDLVVLASASAARAYARLGGGRQCVSIGPVTTAEARRQGLHVAREARSPDLDGLTEAVTLAASRLASSRS